MMGMRETRIAVGIVAALVMGCSGVTPTVKTPTISIGNFRMRAARWASMTNAPSFA